MKNRKRVSDREYYEAWKESSADQRRWNRYPPAEGVLARLEGRTYRLMDISEGGIAIYDYGGENIPEETVISLHSTDEGFFVDAVRCRKVSDSRFITNTPHGPEVINRVGLEIMESDPELERKLAPFMRR